MKSLRLAGAGSLLALVAFCGCNSPTGPLPAGGVHVLFIGNSLTYVNDLPRTLATIALQTQDTIRTRSVAFPDYALEDHVADGTAMEAIQRERWNYVVLQQGPSAVEANRQNLIQVTHYLDPFIKASGAVTAMYMVWPQRVNFADFPRVGGSYLMAAQAVNGRFFPAGLAWIAAWDHDPLLELYDADGLHPSVLGTYLAALVMYEKITGKDARNLPARLLVGGLDLTNQVTEALIRLLQASAHEANVAYPQ